MLDVRRHTIQCHNYTISVARTYTDCYGPITKYSTSIGVLVNDKLVILSSLSKLYNDGKCIDIRGTGQYQTLLEHRVVALLKKVDKYYTKNHYDYHNGYWYLVPQK